MHMYNVYIYIYILCVCVCVYIYTWTVLEPHNFRSLWIFGCGPKNHFWAKSDGFNDTVFGVYIYIYVLPQNAICVGRWSDILLKLLFQPFCSSWNQRTCAGNNIWVGIQLGEQLNHLGWRGFVWKTRGKPSKMWLKKSQKIPIQMTSWGYWGIAHFQTYPSILQIG